jgi:DeoR/GlpR family transcriptional regulator of sugar metabolism
MLALHRRQLILADINHLGAVTISKLSTRFAVSEMTIRRDLKLLEDSGYIERTHGGAVRALDGRVKSHLIVREMRQQLATEQKARIARYAAQHFAADGETIILEGGTTVTAMVDYLKDKQDLTVVTNGLYITNELQRLLSPNANIICAGGILRPGSSTFVGPVVERFFREFHANKLFLSATGLTLEAGITDPHMLETQVKKAMIASASKVIMLLNSSKFGVRSLMTVMNLDEIDVLITDSDSPPEMVEEIRARGVDVRIAL